MAGAKAGYRQKLFRAIHAEAVKRGMDHDALHDMCRSNYGVHSMGDLSEAQLLTIYRGWTGKVIRRRARLADPDWQTQDGMVSAEEINNIAGEAAKRGLTQDGLRNFVRRQLRGRDVIRSKKDYARVITPLIRMNERDGRSQGPSREGENA